MSGKPDRQRGSFYGLRTHMLKGLLLAHSGDQQGIQLDRLAAVSGVSRNAARQAVYNRPEMVKIVGRGKRARVLVRDGLQLGDLGGSGLRVLPKPGSGPKMEHWATRGRVTMGRKRK